MGIYHKDSNKVRKNVVWAALWEKQLLCKKKEKVFLLKRQDKILMFRNEPKDHKYQPYQLVRQKSVAARNNILTKFIVRRIPIVIETFKVLLEAPP
jgi:hypothetical protein